MGNSVANCQQFAVKGDRGKNKSFERRLKNPLLTVSLTEVSFDQLVYVNMIRHDLSFNYI